MARNRIKGSDFESEDEDELINTYENGEKKTTQEKMEDYIRTIQDFCDGLEFQVKFQDHRFLNTMEREGAGFLKFAQDCLSRERRQNSSQAASPMTWERSTPSTLFYRACPCRDQDT